MPPFRQVRDALIEVVALLAPLAVVYIGVKVPRDNFLPRLRAKLFVRGNSEKRRSR